MGFLRFCWVITVFAACLAAGGLAFGMAATNSAPHEAALAAPALAVCAIPYVFTRAIEGLVRPLDRAGRRWHEPDNSDA